jgi:hypothetical protein
MPLYKQAVTVYNKKTAYSYTGTVSIKIAIIDK